MTRILSCIDGSGYSLSVADHSAWLASRLDAGVDLLHVLDRAERTRDGADLSGQLDADAQAHLLGELAEVDAQWARLAQQRGKVILEQLKARLHEAGIADVEYRQRHGSLVESVTALEDGHELVVIGKRGESANFATLHLGSNLERVARASHHPVFVASRAFKPIGHFLIAFDGGASARKAVDYVAASPLLRGLAVTLLSAGSDDARLSKPLERAADQLRQAGFEVTTCIVAGEPDKVIAEKIAKTGVQLLVMGAYGHSRIRSLIIGSTTTAMLRACPVPVLMFR